jgi:hypothetical protein
MPKPEIGSAVEILFACMGTLGVLLAKGTDGNHFTVWQLRGCDEGEHATMHMCFVCHVANAVRTWLRILNVGGW